MIQGAIYNISSGLIIQHFACHESALGNNIGGEREFYLNCPESATHIINNEPVTIIPEPIVPTTEQLLAAIRQKRNTLLSSSDWTQIADSPLTPEKRLEWAVYRQELRDFPDMCDPVDPVWPVAP